MESVRRPAVSGSFYPANSNELHNMVSNYLQSASDSTDIPKAIISPHAGYIYSGAIAASAYKAVEKIADRIKQIILLGPSHHVGFQGLAVPSVSYFETPLGRVSLNREFIDKLLTIPYIIESDQAHEKEHSLEVQIPFLQEIFPSFQLTPIVTGDISPQQVSQVLKALWGSDDTLIVISSDLSHYLDYNSAQQRDTNTSNAILNLQFNNINGHDACGYKAVNGLLHLAREIGLKGKLVDLRNSGDTAGSKDKVVGYGAYHFGHTASKYSNELKSALLKLARDSIEYGVNNGKIMPEFQFPQNLYNDAPTASFVTIEKAGQLRGCIGSLTPHRALAVDIMNNAYSAAFQDQRFPPLSQEELAHIDIKISVLSAAEPIQFTSEADLLEKIRPNIDGLILTEGNHRGTFLPSVWQSLRTPKEFLTNLKTKAGLPQDYWSDTIKVERYTAEYF